MVLIRVMHVILLLVAAWLTLVFATEPYGVGGTFRGYPGFDVMAGMATERSWAVFTGSMALFGFAAIASRSRVLRMLSAAWLCVGFCIIGVFLALGRPYGTGTGPYLGYAALAATLAYAEAYAAQRV